MRTERTCRLCGKAWSTVAKTRVCPQCKYVRNADRERVKARQRKLAWQEAAAGRPRPETCEVCHSRPVNSRAHAWDHNHETGLFRGWLCQLCNVALGSAGDNPVILRALAAYLETNGCSPTRPLIQ